MSIYAPANWKVTGSNGFDGAAVGNVAVAVSTYVRSEWFFFFFFFPAWVDAD